MVTSSLITELDSLFQAYAEGFHAIDGARIADFFYAPCLTVRGDGSIHCFQSRAEIATFFHAVADTYYKEGMRRSEFKNLEVVPIGGRALLATGQWMFTREDGTLFKQWRQSYNLVRVDGTWRILLSTFHVA